MPIAVRQVEVSRWRFREFMMHQSADILQPNCIYCGGFTEQRKIGHMAQAFNLPIANGAGWPTLNVHAMAGLMNGTFVELHLRSEERRVGKEGVRTCRSRGGTYP